jgi:ubiquinone biosynthesis protein COQ4
MMQMQVASESLKPVLAFRAIKRLFANPNDTAQIFIILRAMRGNSGRRAFARFAASPNGTAILRERRNLMARLTDHAALAALPPGSLGRAYFDFMQGENLSAEGLTAPSRAWGEDNLSAEIVLFRDRMRDMHDLNHVLTGYGRDPLGELCLLAFMHAHSRNLGMAMIVLMGLPRLRPAGRGAVWQAWRNGRKGRWFLELDWENLLDKPLDELRRRMAVAQPSRYRVAVTG